MQQLSCSCVWGGGGRGGVKTNPKVAKARRRRKRDRELFEQSAVRELSPLSWSGEVQERGPVVSPSLAPKSEISAHTVIIQNVPEGVHTLENSEKLCTCSTNAAPLLSIDTLTYLHSPPPLPPFSRSPKSDILAWDCCAKGVEELTYVSCDPRCPCRRVQGFMHPTRQTTAVMG